MLPWDGAGGAPALRIERRFVTPLSDVQLLLILVACAAAFGGGAWFVLGRWIRWQSRSLRTLQEVATAYGAGPLRAAELGQRLERAAKRPDDIGILAGKLREMIERIEGARWEQARSQQAQATLNTRLAAIIASASDAVISTDREGRIVLFNPAAERIFGYAAARVLGNNLDMLMPERDRARHGRDIGTFAASGIASRRMGAGRVRGLRADGAALELEASISQVTIDGDQVLTAILRDVTERVRTERALMAYQIELTELTHRLMAQEKATSGRLAQLLHDQLGQTLTAMRIDFVSEARLADAAEAARHARVDRLIDQAVREVRQVLVELRPTVLDERGLVDALDDELALRRASTPGMQWLLDVPPALATQRWNGDVEYAAFMVAREAITNALHHAGATQVRVRLRGGPGALQLEVADNGGGLAVDALVAKAGHLGMVGMRERSIAIGGRFETQSLPGEGATVRLTWEDAKA